MAYATSNPPARIGGNFGGNSVWYYNDGDAIATILGADYFSDGDDLGMTVGDIVLCYSSGDTVPYTLAVTAVTAGGAATVVREPNV